VYAPINGAARPAAVPRPPVPRPAAHAAIDAPTPAPPAASPDYELVRQLQKQVSDQLAAVLKTQPGASEDDRRAEGYRVAAAVVGTFIERQAEQGRHLGRGQADALLAAVIDTLFGFGALEQLLRDPQVVNVHVVGCDHVRIEHRDGTISSGPRLADTDDELVDMLQAIARRNSSTERSISTAKPWVDLQTRDGSRLTALIQVSQRPIVAIRRHTLLDVTLEDLVAERAGATQLIDPLLCDFLRHAMLANLNIMVAGLAGSGKTTLLRALAREIPAAEAFVTLEESRELGLDKTGHQWCISLEAREGHGERGPDGRPAGEVTIADLIPLTLRMSARRVIVGEVRSREIVPMLQAMATSRGSMCTIHARDSRSVMDRIIELALSHGKEMRADLARRMAAGALDVIVYINIEDETTIGGPLNRYVSEVVEVGGMSGEQVVTTTLFGPGPDGRAVPMHQPERLRAALLRVGYDTTSLVPYIERGHGMWSRELRTVIGRRPSW
jgi:Flp pilus assembly CpaF family ATPase